MAPNGLPRMDSTYTSKIAPDGAHGTPLLAGSTYLLLDFLFQYLHNRRILRDKR